MFPDGQSALLSEFYSEEEAPKMAQKCIEVFSHRRRLLQSVCPDITTKFPKMANFSSKEPDFQSVYVNKQRKMLFCAPHKVGSQTWRYFFQRLDARDKQNNIEFESVKKEDYILDGSWPDDIASYSKAFQVKFSMQIVQTLGWKMLFCLIRCDTL